ncbi:MULTISPECIES: hypothetical protein [unclassified Sporosarcina]|uniref:hypothetical protein n=1 Tax=unclassified Sporosarcina TaxID=2647733 RepID=UPI00130456DD|nr:MULTISPECIES: hypothetical protein [unclassified Sporosarcina]
MKSGWLLNFKNEKRYICSEEVYADVIRVIDVDDLESEEHWFSIEKAKEKNPTVRVYG